MSQILINFKELADVIVSSGKGIERKIGKDTLYKSICDIYSICGEPFPFNLVVKHFYPKHNGLYRLEKGSTLYVNRGTGTWGPPMRFLSPPEVTLIELKRAED